MTKPQRDEGSRPMTIAYADPPFPGCAHMYDCPEVDHRALVNDLVNQFPDGWALSTNSTTLKQVLQLCPDDVRIAAWVKPFASFKPNVNPAYAWEPVIFTGGRRRGRDEPTTRDWVSANITLRRGLVGVKPDEFCLWLFDLLGMEPSDTFIDLFPGSGAVTRAWRSFTTEQLFSGSEVA